MNTYPAFRAWHTLEKRMVYFTLDDLLVEYAESDCGHIRENDLYLWHQDTAYLKIMQYIELEDKNGQRIYQGDIVRYGYLALNDAQRYGEEPWKHLPDGIREDWITTVLGAFVIEPNLASIGKVHQLAYDNPDVIGIEIVGNVFQQPFLLQQYELV